MLSILELMHIRIELKPLLKPNDYDSLLISTSSITTSTLLVWIPLKQSTLQAIEAVIVNEL